MIQHFKELEERASVSGSFSLSFYMRISGHYFKLHFYYCDIFNKCINFYLADIQ